MDVYKTALIKARLERERLIQDRDAIDKKISQLNQTIAGLSAIVEPRRDVDRAAADAEGLTKTVLAAFSLVEGPMTPSEIRDKVTELGYTWKNPQNALNAVHVTLKRLLEKQEIKQALVTPTGSSYELDDIPF